MNDYIIKCNIIKCQVPLNETAWITRCFHVFCPPHGHAYFSSSSPQIACPICNEINLKEVDILLCEVNPSDMILVGLSPEKAINMALKALKLWFSQIQEEQALQSMKTKIILKNNNNMKYTYEKVLKKMKIKYESQINGLKTQRHDLTEKLKQKINELHLARDTINQLKEKYNSENMGSRRRVSDPFSPGWEETIDQIRNSQSCLRLNPDVSRTTDSPRNWDIDSIFR